MSCHRHVFAGRVCRRVDRGVCHRVVTVCVGASTAILRVRCCLEKSGVESIWIPLFRAFFPHAHSHVQTTADEHAFPIQLAGMYADHSIGVPLDSLENLLTRHVPAENGAVLAAADGEAERRIVVHTRWTVEPKAPRQTVRGVDVALEGLDDAALDVIPHADAAVQRPGENVFAVRREFDACCGGFVFVDECAQTLPAVRVPDSNETVQCAGDDQCPVENYVDTGDWVGVGGEGAQDTCATHVPDEDGFVVGAADEDVALGCERDRVDVVVVADERFGVSPALRRE